MRRKESQRKKMWRQYSLPLCNATYGLPCQSRNPCRSRIMHPFLVRSLRFLHYVEGGKCRFLWNGGNHQLTTASYPRRLESSSHCWIPLNVLLFLCFVLDLKGVVSGEQIKCVILFEGIQIKKISCWQG